jgi:hypothetical protein
MISYPKSKLHDKLSSNNSSFYSDECSDFKSSCSSSKASFSTSKSSCSNNISKSHCSNSTPLFTECKSFCDDCSISNNCCEKNNYCAKEICTNGDKFCEKTIQFTENHTNGILKITKIKGNLSTGVLKILCGNSVNLNSKIFDGILTLSIINNHCDIIINYNNSQKIELTPSNYCVFQRKNNCDWKLSTMYELKNMSCNYYFKSKNICESTHDHETKKCEDKQKIKSNCSISSSLLKTDFNEHENKQKLICQCSSISS